MGYKIMDPKYVWATLKCVQAPPDTPWKDERVVRKKKAGRTTCNNN